LWTKILASQGGKGNEILAPRVMGYLKFGFQRRRKWNFGT